MKALTLVLLKLLATTTCWNPCPRTRVPQHAT